MKTNFNNCSDIKGIRFFTKKEICPYYCFFFTHKKRLRMGKHSLINKSFPLKPSLDAYVVSCPTCTRNFKRYLVCARAVIWTETRSIRPTLKAHKIRAFLFICTTISSIQPVHTLSSRQFLSGFE
jgi:hypothetical protein